MEAIEIGLKLVGFILAISLCFALVGFLVNKYLGDFFQGLAKLLIKISRSLKKS